MQQKTIPVENYRLEQDLESYKTVKICEDADTICEREVRWSQMTELLQNADEVRLINMLRDEFTTINPNESEIVNKQEYCHIAIVTISMDNQNKVFYTQNSCPWIPDKSLELADSRAIVKALNVTNKKNLP